MTNQEVATTAPMCALARAMNFYTDIRVVVWKSFPIYSPELFKTPFIFLTADDTFVADATLNATFAPGGGTLTGTISNFEGSTVGTRPGSFNVTAGAIAGDTFTATVGGTFNDAGTNRTFTGTTGGAFFGAGAQYLAGALGGTFTGGGTITVDPITTLPNGVLIAEQ